MDTLMILGIILFIVGFILIAVEMVIPGFGAPGISGIACLVIGVFLTADTVAEGAFITVLVLALLGIMMAVIVWMLSIHRSSWRRSRKRMRAISALWICSISLGKKGLRKRI